MKETLVQRLFLGRFKAPQAVREILQIPKSPKQLKQRRRRRPQNHVRAIRNGNYFRMQIPHEGKPVLEIPTNPIPKPTPTAHQVQKAAAAANTKGSGYSRRFFEWFKANLPVITLNFGSMCILVGFSRSDVLELRGLTMTGQLTFAAYNLGQSTILWPSIAWSCLFAGVNAHKILDIFHERNAEVHMTAEQEEVFVEHFMPHGITPKQFERIDDKARGFHLKKGECLIRQGGKLDHLYLVIEGSTHAHILGRRLTAASTSPETKGDQLEGGDSGAWIGEMAFLHKFGGQGEITGNNISESQVASPVDKPGRGVSIYTILADEDCSVISWSHEDMKALMESSADLRAALTRAMTSAIVGKVVNLTVAHSKNKRRRWTTWLSDWRHNDGARIQVQDEIKLPEDKDDAPSLEKTGVQAITGPV
jgi:CRP-like cAMP-binding protein